MFVKNISVIGLLLISIVAASAQAVAPVLPPCDPSKFKDVVVLAKRLHVHSGGQGSMMLHTCSGDYDLLKIIEAVLNKLDKVTK